MRILLTGSGGQVGTEIKRIVAEPDVLLAFSREDLDITDPAAVARAVGERRPDVVINAAAFTAVDRAESDPEAAFAVNRDGAAIVARSCSAVGIPLVHISTDYVFDGTKPGPYVPGDPVSPINAYGRSKAEGEDAVRAALVEHVIVRTAWVFSSHGRNFVRTMANLARERNVLSVVSDQFGHPTWAGDVARICLELARVAVGGIATWGTIHVAGLPLATWHDLATAVVEEMGQGAMTEVVQPIPTSAYATPADRPPRVELDMTALLRDFGIAPPVWRSAVRKVVEEIERPHA